MSPITAIYEPPQAPKTVFSREFRPPPTENIRLPIPRLMDFLGPLNFKGQCTEWGVPFGSISRLIPAMVAKALGQECLWICDQSNKQIYPNSWSGLGFDLDNLHFLNEQQPLSSLRTLIHENHFPFLIVDSQQFFKKSDFHFLAQATRQYGITLFLFRPYFLSNKNGNPFCRYRINSSYCITGKNFRLSVLKGLPARHIRLAFDEVLCG